MRAGAARPCGRRLLLSGPQERSFFQRTLPEIPSPATFFFSQDRRASPNSSLLTELVASPAALVLCKATPCLRSMIASRSLLNRGARFFGAARWISDSNDTETEW